MLYTKGNSGVLAATFAALVIAGVGSGAPARMHTLQSSDSNSDESGQIKIARAMSAGPADVAKAARIVDTDAHGKPVVLREGNNGFTCMPGNPKVVGDPPMCVDAASMQWYADAKAHKPRPTNTVPGITYMLAGATQLSDSDPHDSKANGIRRLASLPASPSAELTRWLFPGFIAEDAQTSGATIHTLRKGSGPPLLLLHGYPETHVSWHKVANQLAARFSAVLPDLRGYGDSSKPQGGERQIKLFLSRYGTGSDRDDASLRS